MQSFLFSAYTHNGDLHSFPTRRSSDLLTVLTTREELLFANDPGAQAKGYVLGAYGKVLPKPSARSEEHTSELQSRRDLVCRLLLEKKKQEVSTFRLNNCDKHSDPAACA